MSKRVLVISPVPTHPTSLGNRVRIVSLLTILRDLGHAVHFAYIQKENGDEEAMAACWGAGFHLIPYRRKPESLGHRLYKKIKAVAVPSTVHTYDIDDWYDRGTDKYLLELHNRFKFDVVIVEYVFFSKALECFGSDVLKIIDTHDVFTNRHKIYLENGEKPKWFSTSQRQEAKGLRRADIIIAIQDHERALLSRFSGRPVITVGHSVDLIPPTDRSIGHSILYVGSRNSINVQSVNHFISEVLPRVRTAVPSAKFYVAGNVCDEVNSGEGVVKLGRVGDLEEVYALADVVINPMLYGTGLKVKNVEALGYSKPLITSSAGAKGLEAGSGTAFLVADSAEEWSESVIKVLQDSDFNQSLARKAFDFAQLWNKEITDSLTQLVQAEARLRRVS